MHVFVIKMGGTPLIVSAGQRSCVGCSLGKLHVGTFYSSSWAVAFVECEPSNKKFPIEWLLRGALSLYWGAARTKQEKGMLTAWKKSLPGSQSRFKGRFTQCANLRNARLNCLGWPSLDSSTSLKQSNSKERVPGVSIKALIFPTS